MSIGDKPGWLRRLLTLTVGLVEVEVVVEVEVAVVVVVEPAFPFR